MFLIGKILLLFLRPIVWIIVLFCWGLLTKKEVRKKRLLLSAFLLLLFFSNPFFLRIVARSWETAPVVLDRTYDAGIVLGGFVAYNASSNEAHFNPASDRFIQTALLYKQGFIRSIIVAAGNGYVTKHDFQEAAYIRDRLSELGIPDSSILIDPYSRNTLENARNASRIFDSIQLKPPAVLITSAMHMPRAAARFRKQGMAIEPYPCDFHARSIANNFWEDYLIPSADSFREWHSLIKEILGLTIYKITGKA